MLICHLHSALYVEDRYEILHAAVTITKHTLPARPLLRSVHSVMRRKWLQAARCFRQTFQDQPDDAAAVQMSSAASLVMQNAAEAVAPTTLIPEKNEELQIMFQKCIKRMEQNTFWYN